MAIAWPSACVEMNERGSSWMDALLVDPVSVENYWVTYWAGSSINDPVKRKGVWDTKVDTAVLRVERGHAD